MNIDILTLFPEMFESTLGASMIGRAQEKGILDIKLTDIRDYTLDKHNKTDEYPFGGGPGMSMDDLRDIGSTPEAEAEEFADDRKTVVVDLSGRDGE